MNATNLAEERFSSTSQSWILIDLLKFRRKFGNRGTVVPFEIKSSQCNAIVVESQNQLVSKYPLTLDQKVEEIKKRLSEMSHAEKWEIVRESFGMWEDYPKDWLDNIRSGNLRFNHMVDTSNKSDVIFSG